MNSSIQLKTPTRFKRNSIRRIVLITLLLACFGFSQAAQAVSPPPDGGYPGNNTAEGTNALLSLTSGINNTAVGLNALLRDTTGGYNVGVGSQALATNTTGNFNMAIGTQALFNNTASANMAVGFRVLFNNTTGNNLTGIGTGALFMNTTGNENTAIGSGALNSNTTGDQNTANGASALLNNTTGNYNTAVGSLALYQNTTGYVNIALGQYAGGNLTTGSFNIDIGNSGSAGDSNTIRIGGGNNYLTFIAGIHGATASGGAAVYVNSDGKLGTVTSSARFKQDIQEMGTASETVLALRPVTFRYKPELDPNGIPQFGLVAEEVEKVNPDLVARDAERKVYTVRYEAVNAMLLNEFLKEHRKVQEQGRKAEEQEATIARLKKDFGATIAQLTARLDEQATQIQKVSAQLAVSKPALQVVRTNQ